MTAEDATIWRQWQAILAKLQRDLLSPVNAIRAYGDRLGAEAARLGLDALLPDLKHIATATGDLGDMVDRLSEEGLARTYFRASDLAESQKKLRHDIRTPINAIKGYGEMLLEDLDELDGETLRPDVVKMLQETNHLLSRLYIIAGQAEAAAVDGPAAAVAEPGPRAAGAITGHVLAVDDVKDIRTMLSRRLKRDGHRVTTAADGEKALRLLEAEKFDLVLLDVMMPGLDGIEVLKRLKADVDLREIPVIIISALDEMDKVVECIESGAEDFLHKPFNPVLLRARIIACLEKKQWRDGQREYLDVMVAAMDRVEHGDLNIRLPVTGSDVYANLYSGFNHMVEGLRDEAHILDVAQKPVRRAQPRHAPSAHHHGDDHAARRRPQHALYLRCENGRALVAHRRRHGNPRDPLSRPPGHRRRGVQERRVR